MIWELVFMLIVLKIPILYLCAVVYWAIKAEPAPPEPALLPVAVEPEPPTGWTATRRRPRGRRGGPHGSPDRGYLRTRRAALVRARFPRR